MRLACDWQCTEGITPICVRKRILAEATTAGLDILLDDVEAQTPAGLRGFPAPHGLIAIDTAPAFPSTLALTLSIPEPLLYPSSRVYGERRRPCSAPAANAAKENAGGGNAGPDASRSASPCAAIKPGGAGAGTAVSEWMRKREYGRVPAYLLNIKLQLAAQEAAKQVCLGCWVMPWQGPSIASGAECSWV